MSAPSVATRRFRRPAAVLAMAAALVLVAVPAAAEILVLKDGRVYEAEGPIVRDGELLIFTYDGQRVTIRRLMVDEAKSDRLNRLMRSGADGETFNRAVDQAMASPGSGAPRPVPLYVYHPIPIGAEIGPATEGDTPFPQGEYPLSADVPRYENVEDTARYPGPAWPRVPVPPWPRVPDEAEEEGDEGATAPAPPSPPAERPTAAPRRRPSAAQPPAPPAERPSRTTEPRPSASDRATQASRERLDRVNQQLAEERKNLNALTELKSSASELVATDVRSLDTDIRRSQRRIESLEAEKARLEKALQTP